MEDIEYELDRYHTNKILDGQGLQDDPAWVTKLEQMWEDNLED
jgi:hypothetical protein